MYIHITRHTNENHSQSNHQHPPQQWRQQQQRWCHPAQRKKRLQKACERYNDDDKGRKRRETREFFKLYSCFSYILNNVYRFYWCIEHREGFNRANHDDNGPKRRKTCRLGPMWVFFLIFMFFLYANWYIQVLTMYRRVQRRQKRRWRAQSRVVWTLWLELHTTTPLVVGKRNTGGTGSEAASRMTGRRRLETRRVSSLVRFFFFFTLTLPTTTTRLSQEPKQCPNGGYQRINDNFNPTTTMTASHHHRTTIPASVTTKPPPTRHNVDLKRFVALWLFRNRESLAMLTSIIRWVYVLHNV